jgi:hypothetical protein
MTAMVREIRNAKINNGLILANGGVATYQHVICLSKAPRKSPYPKENPLPRLLDDVPVPEVDESVEGEATIEVCLLKKDV